MGGAESSSDMASKEQAWAVLVEVLDLLQSRAKVGADFSRVWVMSEVDWIRTPFLDLHPLLKGIHSRRNQGGTGGTCPPPPQVFSLFHICSVLQSNLLHTVPPQSKSLSYASDNESILRMSGARE